MPLYSFTCKNCGNKQEILCSVSERNSPIQACLRCGSDELERQFGAFSVNVVKKSTGCLNACECPTGCGGSGRSCPHARD